jgi:hypothetical protein
VQTKTKDLLGFSFRGVLWKRAGKTGERSFVCRLVKFEIFVQALLQQIVHKSFTAPAVNNNTLKLNKLLHLAQ